MEYTLTKADGCVSIEGQSFDAICSRLPNGTYTLSVTKRKKPRSLSQNSLMWMWFACLEDATGQSKDDWHEYYKLKFLPKFVTVRGWSVRVGGSTKRLDTAQMSAYMDKIQADAATEFGVTLPLPSDRFYKEFVEQYKDR